MRRGDVKRAQEKGIFKEMDRLGRIVVPKELREHLGMQPLKLIELSLNTEGIYVRLPRFEVEQTDKRERGDITKAREVGLIKEIDCLGRIVIPKEIRDFLKIEPYDPLEIFLVDDGLLIRNPAYRIVEKK